MNINSVGALITECRKMDKWRRFHEDNSLMEKPWKYIVRVKTFTHYRLIGSLFLNYILPPLLQILSKSKKAKMSGKCLITSTVSHSALK
jgi:hypothetical protein